MPPTLVPDTLNAKLAVEAKVARATVPPTLVPLTDSAKLEVARECLERGTGARGLRSVLEKALLEVQFKLPRLASEGAQRIIVDDEVIKRKKEPMIIYSEARNKVTRGNVA